MFLKEWRQKRGGNASDFPSIVFWCVNFMVSAVIIFKVFKTRIFTETTDQTFIFELSWRMCMGHIGRPKISKVMTTGMLRCILQQVATTKISDRTYLYFLHVASSKGALSRYVHGYPPFSLSLFTSSHRYVSGGTGGLYSFGDFPTKKADMKSFMTCLTMNALMLTLR